MEMMLVLSIITLLVAISGPALQGLSGAGTVNKAIDDLSSSIDYARTYAQAHNCYVRIALSQVPSGPGGSSTPATLVLILYPANGDISTPMSTGGGWLPVNRMLILSNLLVNDGLNASSPNTSQDAYPSQSNIVNSASSFTWPFPGISPNPTFTACIQLTPLGEAQVLNGTPARYIKIAFDRPAPQNGRDPFILRLSGINGNVATLRKEDGIQ